MNGQGAVAKGMRLKPGMRWGAVLLVMGCAGPAGAECTAPGCHDSLFIGLSLMAVGLVLALVLAMAGTVWLIRHGRGRLAIAGWMALLGLLWGLAHL